MSETPSFGLAVADLQRSIDFYRDQIGLTVQPDTGHRDTAFLITPQNLRFVLAGPNAPRWDQILADDATILKPGEKIFVADPEFDDRLERIRNDGTLEFTLIERPWGDRLIEAVCPDGYGVSCSAIQRRSRPEILSLATLAGDGFRAAVVDLNDDDQRWRPGPEEWSIREIVHHVADANLSVLHAVRVALAGSGNIYRSNPYDQNHYAGELCYQERELEPSIRLLEALHDVLLSMIATVPDAWSRTVRTSSGAETSVGTYLEMQAIHWLEHLEQINDIRDARGHARYQYPVR